MNGKHPPTEHSSRRHEAGGETASNNLLDPSTEQHFHLPSVIRNRLGRFKSDPVFVALACELLARKNAHQEYAAIPANYVREAYGRRVHEALKELAELEFVNRAPYVAPNQPSREWNLEKGYITEEEAEEMEENEEGRAFKYEISERVLARSKWVVWTARREDYHHHTWNAIFQQGKAEWEKASKLQATEGLTDALDGTDRPHWKPLALANRRLTFNWTGDTLGRRYTTFGVMESQFRQHFRIGGEPLVELDLSSSVFFHLFGSLNRHRETLTNEHGYWHPEATELVAKNEMSPQGTPDAVLHYYDGSKMTTDYRKQEYIDLDSVINAVSDDGDVGFYELLQAHMDGIYEHPTRELAKTQANTWANSEDYFTYEQGGETKKNWKRIKLQNHLEDTLTVGCPQYPVLECGLAAMLDVLGGRTGCGMMREEAKMMLGEVQPAVEAEVGTETLAVHDALYVPESKAQEAKTTMKEVYRDEYGIAPKIDCG
jgi:hypothetical protein